MRREPDNPRFLQEDSDSDDSGLGERWSDPGLLHFHAGLKEIEQSFAARSDSDDDDLDEKPNWSPRAWYLYYRDGIPPLKFLIVK